MGRGNPDRTLLRVSLLFYYEFTQLLCICRTDKISMYSQLSNKQIGWNKLIGWNFFFKFNKRVGKIWCCLPVKCPQIRASRVAFFLEKNKRACLFIRELRVGKLSCMLFRPEFWSELATQSTTCPQKMPKCEKNANLGMFFRQEFCLKFSSFIYFSSETNCGRATYWWNYVLNDTYL